MPESALDWFAKQTGSKIVSLAGERLAGLEDPAVETPAKVAFTGGYGETDPSNKGGVVKLDDNENTIGESFFSRFMDGARMAYKIAELNFGGKVWPVVAGQIGVAWCIRKNRRMAKGDRLYRTLLSVPRIVCDLSGSESANRERLNVFLEGVNNIVSKKWNGRFRFDEIVVYGEKGDMSKENLAVSRIQSRMADTEKKAIKELADQGIVNPDEWLIKDGSLEYLDENSSTIKWSDLGSSLRYAVGVSKTFNAENFSLKVQTEKQSASSFVANLKVGCRTQAFRYSVHRDKLPVFAIWFVRIRSPKLGHSAFDGVLKVEVQLLGNEVETGRLSAEIDNISRCLIRERNPVCFGTDVRWANHLYPVFATERYLKSGFFPEAVFHAIAL